MNGQAKTDSRFMFVIRPASAEDREWIRRIYFAAAGNRAGLNEAYRDELIRRGGLLVAQSEDEVIGFGGIDVNATEQLQWLYFLPSHQGVGIGSQLLKRLERIGWETGLSSLRVHSAPGAVKFYRKHGYRIVEAAKQIGHDHEGIEMIKERRTDEM